MNEQRSCAYPVHEEHPELTVTPTQPSALDLILQTSGGYCVARALHVVADLGIADHIADEPIAIINVAQSAGVDGDAVGRLLSLLSAHGLFWVANGAVAHNDASRTLRTDHPQSTRDLARMFGLPFFWQTFEGLDHSLKTGQPAAAKMHPQGVWAWLSERPEASAVFNAAMTAKSSGQIAGVIGSYDFSAFGRIADVGGGRGHLLRAVLDTWPQTTGVLFEQPHVIDEVGEIGSGRLELRAGDFFADGLPVADAYILMEVIHDWNDDDALRILAAIAAAAPQDSTLLLIEQLMPDSPGPHWVKMLDVHMMALFAARQRSAEEYDRLAEQAGFGRRGVIHTPAGISIIEYQRA